MTKKIDDEVKLEICDVIVSVLIYGYFGAFWKPDYEDRVYKTYVFINSNLLPCKSFKKN